MFALLIALAAAALVIPAVLRLLEPLDEPRWSESPEAGETPELLRRPLRSRYLS
jgi:hypothetical protein